jgi:hypothetical protein
MTVAYADADGAGADDQRLERCLLERCLAPFACWRGVWHLSPTDSRQTPEGYDLTADSALRLATAVQRGVVKVGFQTPSLAFGADLVLDCEGVTRPWGRCQTPLLAHRYLICPGAANAPRHPATKPTLTPG